jgi:hypothetical protein
MDTVSTSPRSKALQPGLEGASNARRAALRACRGVPAAGAQRELEFGRPARPVSRPPLGLGSVWGVHAADISVAKLVTGRHQAPDQACHG